MNQYCTICKGLISTQDHKQVKELKRHSCHYVEKCDECLTYPDMIREIQQRRSHNMDIDNFIFKAIPNIIEHKTFNHKLYK